MERKKDRKQISKPETKTRSKSIGIQAQIPTILNRCALMVLNISPKEGAQFCKSKRILTTEPEIVSAKYANECYFSSFCYSK